MGDQPIQRGIGQMRRLLLAIALILLFMPDLHPQAQVTTGEWCEDYTPLGTFLSHWNYENGIEFAGDSLLSVYRTVSKQQLVKVWRNVPLAQYSAGSIDLLIEPSYVEPPGTYNTNPYLITITLYGSNSAVVYEQTFSQAAPGSLTAVYPRYTLPSVGFVNIDVLVTQDPVVPGVLSEGFIFKVRRFCGHSPFPTTTPTPTDTHIPPTATVGPSRTPRPTLTSTRTPSPTPTRTKVPTWTPTPTFTRTPTRTPTATRTATGTRTPTVTRTPTDTPIPPVGDTDTPVPSETALATETDLPTETAEPSESPQPTELPPPTEPMQSTLAEFNNDTPQPPDSSCTDPADNCQFFPEITLPDWDISSPTAVSMLPSLTPLASTTPLVLATEGTPVIPLGLGQFATAVFETTDNVQDASELDSASGTTITIAQQAYNAGVNIAGYFSTLKSILNSDIGPVGGFILFLLAMIVLNIQIRLILFLIPIIRKIIEFISSIVEKVIKFIAFAALVFMLWAVPTDSARAQSPTQTWTPFPTWTPTPALVLTVPPSPTSKYAGLRPSPSPLPTYSVPPELQNMFDTKGAAGSLADNVINEYRFFNTFAVLDMLAFFGMAAICILFAVRIHKRLTRDVQ